jgi:hypothetical protein
MTRSRFKNQQWTFGVSDNGSIPSWEQVGVAVLLDIRDELQTLNRLLNCPKFIGIPGTLDRIARNTTKSKKKKRTA